MEAAHEQADTRGAGFYDVAWAILGGLNESCLREKLRKLEEWGLILVTQTPCAGAKYQITEYAAQRLREYALAQRARHELSMLFAAYC